VAAAGTRYLVQLVLGQYAKPFLVQDEMLIRQLMLVTELAILPPVTPDDCSKAKILAMTCK
jgi:hypothetical protein